MKKTQRQEIIEQINDLSKHRKSIEISDSVNNGINYTDSIPSSFGVSPHDSIIIWDSLSLFADFLETPTIELFDTLLVSNIYSVIHREVASLNSLIDHNFTYSKFSKYEVTIVPSDNIRATLTFSGKCKASLYINGIRILWHEYISGNNSSEVTTTSTKYTFSKDKEYTIALVCYANLNQSDIQISLTSDIFRHILKSYLPTLPEPINVFASNNLPGLIKVSWQQNQQAALAGGGVEIFSKDAEFVDSTFSLLAKVPYPTDYYMHSAEPGLQDVNANPNFNIISSQTNGNVIPNGSINILGNWSVSYNDTLYTLIWDTEETLGYGHAIYLNNITNNSYFADNVLDYSITPASDIKNYSQFNSVELYSDVSYYVESGLKHAFPFLYSPQSMIFRFPWVASKFTTDTSVGVQIFNSGGLIADVTVNALNEKYDYTCSSVQISNLLADYSSVWGRIQTGPKYVGSDPQISIFASSPRFLVQQASNNSSLTLTTDYISIEPESNYTLDIIESGIQQGNITARIYYYNSGVYSGTELINSSAFSYAAAGDWDRVSSSFSANPNFDSMKIKVTFSLTDTKNVASVVRIQRIGIVTQGMKALPPSKSYTYKLRNYSNNYRYSAYTDEFVGRTLAPDTDLIDFKFQVFGNLSAELSDNYIGTQTPLQLYVILSTEPISAPTLEVYSDSVATSTNVDLELLYKDPNGYDFTYLYKPLLSKCVIYDTFRHDQTMSGGALIGGLVSSEDSMMHVDCLWNNSLSNISLESDNDLWPYPNTDYQSRLNITQFTQGDYKIYNINGLSSEYRNVLGNPDSIIDNFLYNDGKHDSRFSIGFILNLNSCHTGTSEYRFAKGDYLFSCQFQGVDANYPGYGKLIIRIKGSAYPYGNDDGGDIIFTRHIPVDTNWYYVHISYDKYTYPNTEKTYIVIINENGDEITEPESSLETVYARRAVGAHEGLGWNKLTNVKLGAVSGGMQNNLKFKIDQFYLTCDYVLKSHLINTFGYLFGSSDPNFYTFGYDNINNRVQFHISAHFPKLLELHGTQDSIPITSEYVEKDVFALMDFAIPDGTMAIMLDTFTLTQDNIKNPTEEEPLLTYTEQNKVFVDCTSDGAPVYRIRFSNDKVNWGNWLPFTNHGVYPWNLTPYGDDDLNPQVVRNTYFQAMTITGNTTDPWLQEHGDSILYDPGRRLGTLKSYNYVPGTSGWMLNFNGELEVGTSIVRDITIVLGKTLNPLKLAETNIGTQVDSTYTKNTGFGKTYTEVPYGEITFLKSRPMLLFNDLYSGYGEDPGYGQDVINYNTHIEIDLDDKNIIYVPIRLNNFLGIMRWDTKQDSYAYSYTSGLQVSSTIDAFMQTHICLSKENIYTGAYNYLRCMAKPSFGFVIKQYALSSSESIADMRMFNSRNDELRIAVLTINKVTRVRKFHIFDGDLLLKYSTTLLPFFDEVRAYAGSSFDQVRYHVDTFDINRDLFVYTCGPSIFGNELTDDGLPTGALIVHDFDNIRRAIVGNPSILGDGLIGGFGSYDNEPWHDVFASERFKPMNGVFLIGNNIFVYTKLGDSICQQSIPDSERFISYGTYGLLYYGGDRVELINFGIYSDRVFKERIFLPAADVRRSFIHRVPNLGGSNYNSYRGEKYRGAIEPQNWEIHRPYYPGIGSDMFNMVNEYMGMGMCRPTLINNRLVTALTLPTFFDATNFSDYGSSSLYKFNIIGNSLSDPEIYTVPSIRQGENPSSNTRILDIKNDGQYTHYMAASAEAGYKVKLYYRRELA